MWATKAEGMKRFSSKQSRLNTAAIVSSAIALSGCSSAACTALIASILWCAASSAGDGDISGRRRASCSAVRARRACEKAALLKDGPIQCATHSCAAESRAMPERGRRLGEMPLMTRLPVEARVS